MKEGKNKIKGVERKGKVIDRSIDHINEIKWHFCTMFDCKSNYYSSNKNKFVGFVFDVT